MSVRQPRLKLIFAGPGFSQGAVPLLIVAEKLQALQQAVFHAAAAASGHRGQRRGLWFNRYRSAAELTFVTSHHSDLTIEAELAANPVLVDEFNVGLDAVDLLFDVAAAVESDSLTANLPTLTPADRDFLLRSLEGLMPNVGDQYVVRLENGRPDRHPAVTFDGNSRARLRGYATQSERPFDVEEVVLIGEVIRIHVDAGEDKITLRSRQQEIDCFYGDVLRDRVANLIAGSVVEASGFATLDASGQVRKLYRLTDVVPVSVEPLRVARFECDGRVFTLNKHLAVNVEYTDELWVYHHPDLNLWGYASRREDAWRDLQAWFAYVYHEFVEEGADGLDAVARQLRGRLLSLEIEVSGEATRA